MGVESMLPLVFGLATLLVLQLVVVRGTARKRSVIGLFAGGLAVGVAVVGWWLAAPRYLPNASTSGLAVAVVEDIRKGLDTEEPTLFLILDGGSYSARGVDDAMLEQRLSRSLGRPVEILNLSLAGGNQLERWSILKRSMALLSKQDRARFDAAAKALLFEIHGQYDRYPLVQLRRNRHSDRAYAYLDIDVLREVLRADHGVMDWQTALGQWTDVASHVAINSMNVGKATRVVPADDVERAEAYIPLDRPVRGYKFPGTKAVKKRMKQAVPPIDELPWRNIELRRERYGRVLGKVPEVIYFSVPTPRTSDLDYARAFCGDLQGMPCVTHAHWGMLGRLDHASLWYDSGHLQRKGAGIYTRWLVPRLAEVLKDETQR